MLEVLNRGLNLEKMSRSHNWNYNNCYLVKTPKAFMRELCAELLDPLVEACLLN